MVRRPAPSSPPYPFSLRLSSFFHLWFFVLFMGKILFLVEGVRWGGDTGELMSSLFMTYLIPTGSSSSTTTVHPEASGYYSTVNCGEYIASYGGINAKGNSDALALVGRRRNVVSSWCISSRSSPLHPPFLFHSITSSSLYSIFFSPTLFLSQFEIRTRRWIHVTTSGDSPPSVDSALLHCHNGTLSVFG